VVVRSTIVWNLCKGECHFSRSKLDVVLVPNSAPSGETRSLARVLMKLPMSALFVPSSVEAFIKARSAGGFCICF
jgi:hypothetical protein